MIFPIDVNNARSNAATGLRRKTKNKALPYFVVSVILFIVPEDNQRYVKMCKRLPCSIK